MLLVDDYDAEIDERSKDRRAGADDNPRVATPDSAPLVEPFAVREIRVQDRNRVSEMGRKLAREDRRQVDLGHEHQRRSAPLEGRTHRPDVDFGLSASRHAVQEKRLVPAFRHGCADLGDRAGLVERELHVVDIGDRGVCERVPANLLDDDDDAAPLFESAHDRRAGTGHVEKDREWNCAATTGELGKDALLGVGRATAVRLLDAFDDTHDVSALRLHASFARASRDACEALPVQFARHGRRAGWRRAFEQFPNVHLASVGFGESGQGVHERRFGAAARSQPKRFAPGVGDREVHLARHREAGGKGGFQAFPPGRVIVVRNPLRQLEDLSGENRSLVDELLDFANRRRFEAFAWLVVNCDDEARHDGVADRNQYPATRLGVRRERRGKSVGVGLPHVERHGDLDVLVEELGHAAYPGNRLQSRRNRRRFIGAGR